MTTAARPASAGEQLDAIMRDLDDFGAMIRSDWTCQVRDEGESWTLISMTGLT